MQSDKHLWWLDSLRRFAKLVGGVCRVGTLFSGSDLLQKVLTSHSEYWEAVFNVKVKFEFVLAAERVPEKQQFLRDHSPSQVLLGDVADCHKSMPQNIIQADKALQNKVAVPWCHWLWAGFPCTSKSKANPKRAQNKGCLRAGVAATGEGFAMVKKYAQEMSPWMITLENVSELVLGDAGQTDADFIVESLEECGFWTKYFSFDAADFGSFSTRTRTYWQGVRCSGVDEGVATQLHRLLVALRLDADMLGLERFLVFDEKDRSRIMEEFYPDPVSRKPRVLYDPLFKDEHNAFFRAANMQWPPDLSKLDQHKYKFGGYPQRPCELMFFLDRVFPAPQDKVEQNGVIREFCDVGQGMKRLLRCLPDQDKEWANPWQERMPTITGHALMAMRTTSVGGSIEVRVVEGFELMAVAGWDMSFYQQQACVPHGAVLTSLAGNAFSAFAAGPMAMLGVCAAGHLLPSCPGKEPAATVVDVDEAASDDGLLLSVES